MLVAGAFGRILAMLVATIVLARLLSPEDFGVASLVTSIVVVLTVFAGGIPFEEALTQRKVLRSSHLGAVLAVSWLASGALLAAALTLGWLTGAAFGSPIFWYLLAFGCLSFFARGVITILTSVVRRRRKFNLIARSDLLGALAGSTVAVALAWLEAGAFSLVALRVVASAAAAAYLVLAIRVELRPVWSTSQLRQLAGFSAFTLGQRLISDGSYLILNYVVAIWFSLAAVGHLNMALRLIEPFRGVGKAVSHNICFAFFQKSEEQSEQFESLFLHNMALVALLVFPVFFGLASIATVLLEVLVGPKWLPAVPITQILALGAALMIPLSLVATALNARGAPSHLFLQRLVGLGAMLVAGIGVVALGLSGVGAALMRTIADLAEAAWALRAQVRVLRIKVTRTLKAIAPALAAAIIMSAAVHALALLGRGHWSPVTVLLAALIVGATVNLLALAAISPLARQGMQAAAHYARRRISTKLRQRAEG
jgi:O-antigen/teichoic acid export membrane protein